MDPTLALCTVLNSFCSGDLTFYSIISCLAHQSLHELNFLVLLQFLMKETIQQLDAFMHYKSNRWEKMESTPQPGFNKTLIFRGSEFTH